jgi:hypothetical protein
MQKQKQHVFTIYSIHIVPQIKDMGTIEIAKLKTENAHRVLM